MATNVYCVFDKLITIMEADTISISMKHYITSHTIHEIVNSHDHCNDNNNISTSLYAMLYYI